MMPQDLNHQLACIVGAVCIGFALWQLVKFVRLRRLPCVQATVVSVEPGLAGLHPDSSYFARVSFHYTITGQTFTSTRLYSSGEHRFDTSRAALASVRELSPGSTVVLRYDPRQPHFAFLRDGPLAMLVIPLIVGVGLCAVGLLHTPAA